jgi:chemotaxis-related protein WspD
MEPLDRPAARPQRDVRALFDREPPPDYGIGWTDAMARLRQDPRERTLLVFRIGGERLALSLGAVVSVSGWRAIHSVPHRRDETLLGIVNIDGELQLCVSLEVLFDLPRPDIARPAPTARLLVLGHGAAVWVVPVTETIGLRQVVLEELSRVPATLQQSTSPYVRGLFESGEHHVGVLDDELLLGSLQRRFA